MQEDRQGRRICNMQDHLLQIKPWALSRSQNIPMFSKEPVSRPAVIIEIDTRWLRILACVKHKPSAEAVLSLTEPSPGLV